MLLGNCFVDIFGSNEEAQVKKINSAPSRAQIKSHILQKMELLIMYEINFLNLIKKVNCLNRQPAKELALETL
ncbi:hypothetical protein CWC21_15475 [Pseudoalteromonas phenolica]|nr:hypothetical protein CWC21_15475 [Pseudoalteromonas phenolica]